MTETRSRRLEGRNGYSERTWSPGRGMTDAREMESAGSGRDRLQFLNIGTARQKGTKTTENPESGKEMKKMIRQKIECYLGAQDTHGGKYVEAGKGRGNAT